MKRQVGGLGIFWGLLLGAAPLQVQADSADSFWGVSPAPESGAAGAAASDPDKPLSTQVRLLLEPSPARVPRETAVRKLGELLPALHAMVQRHPDEAEGFSLLGRTYLQVGQQREALPALRRAADLLSITADEPRVLLPLALLLAQEGDLPGALEVYRRLLRHGTGQALLLRRTGDVLMAMGRLDEAVPLYQRACVGSRLPSLRDVARGCYALAVALDRQELVGKAAFALRTALTLDPGQRSLTPLSDEGIADFVPPAERDYYLALRTGHGQGPRCEEAVALRSYLEDLAKQGPRPGWGYPQRAKERLERLAGACHPGYSGRLDVPLGSQRDRDGGAPWQ